MARYITRLMLILGVVALLYGCKTATIPIPEAKPITQVEYQMLVIGEDQAHPIVVPIPAHLPDYRSMAINVLPAPCGEFSERGFFFFRFHSILHFFSMTCFWVILIRLNDFIIIPIISFYYNPFWLSAKNRLIFRKHD